jgi:hypothetical protein
VFEGACELLLVGATIQSEAGTSCQLLKDNTQLCRKIGHKKALPVLGCVGIYHDGNTMVKSGASISGMAYYIAKFYDDPVFNPLFVDGKTRGIIEVKSVFGQKTTVKIEFTEISLEKAKSMIENIDQIDREIA